MLRRSLFSALVLALVALAFPSTVTAGICEVITCEASQSDPDNDGFCGDDDQWTGLDDCQYQAYPLVGDFLTAKHEAFVSWPKSLDIADYQFVLVGGEQLWAYIPAQGVKIKFYDDEDGKTNLPVFKGLDDVVIWTSSYTSVNSSLKERNPEVIDKHNLKFSYQKNFTGRFHGSFSAMNTDLCPVSRMWNNSVQIYKVCDEDVEGFRFVKNLKRLDTAHPTVTAFTNAASPSYEAWPRMNGLSSYKFVVVNGRTVWAFLGGKKLLLTYDPHRYPFDKWHLVVWEGYNSVTFRMTETGLSLCRMGKLTNECKVEELCQVEEDQGILVYELCQHEDPPCKDGKYDDATDTCVPK